MKALVTVSIALALAVPAHAEQLYQYQGKTITKVEAVKILLKNPGSEVQKACRAELTDKMTLRCVKSNGKKVIASDN